LPVFQFDAQDCSAGLVNYWGYAPVSFFAPHTKPIALARIGWARWTSSGIWSRHYTGRESR
jgi:hypothetical protein